MESAADIDQAVLQKAFRAECGGNSERVRFRKPQVSFVRIDLTREEHGFRMTVERDEKAVSLFVTADDLRCFAEDVSNLIGPRTSAPD